MTDKKIRVRFAPSPTGPLHLGGIRTALYNYLFARHHGGTFVLRIEDTDRTRFVEGAESYINEALRWCGINIDEGVYEGGGYGPYRQSERNEIYGEYVIRLINSGDAYYAFDTAEELDQMRAEHESRGETFIYNHTVREGLHSVRDGLRNSLAIPEDEWQSLIEKGTPYVVRFRMPADSEVRMNDLIRGDIIVNSSTLDDKVLYKSDGMPTYHLANIVDDHLMKISHVIRGEEWLPSLPLHVMLYRAFGWEEPQFAHLPLLLKPSGKGKLSKRDGDKLGFPVFPLFWPHGETARGYREEGYFPDAFVNMLALLGWNPGTEQEIFSMEELIAAFSLERVGKSGSRFDPDKAKWFNNYYMQLKSVAELAESFSGLLRGKGIQVSQERVVEVVSMVKERASFIHELWDQSDYFFIAPETFDEQVVKKRWKKESAGMMISLAEFLRETEPFTSAITEEKVKEWINKNGYGMGNVLNLFRLLMVGASRGPHLFDIIGWLGRDETIRRIEMGVDRLNQTNLNPG